MGCVKGWFMNLGGTQRNSLVRPWTVEGPTGVGDEGNVNVRSL